MSLVQTPTKLLANIRQIWETARTQAVRSVNTAYVHANWLIANKSLKVSKVENCGLFW